jgi:hypothetical protein
MELLPLSKRLKIAPAVSSHRFRSNFDRAAIVDNAERRLVELTSARSLGSGLVAPRPWDALGHVPSVLRVVGN